MPKKENKNTKPEKPLLFKIFIACFIIVFIITSVFIAKYFYNRIYQSVYDKEVERFLAQYGIDPAETEGVTKERTEQITDQVLGTAEESEGFECNLNPKPREFNKKPYYTGALIDAHVHMPVASKIVSSVAIQSGFEDMPYEGDIRLDYINCLFESEGIKKSFGFFLIPNLASKQAVNSIKSAEDRNPGNIVPFYMPMPIAAFNPTPKEAEEIIDESNGLFKGIGEIKFAYDEVENAHPEDPEYLELYKIAGRKNLAVMMHPKPAQIDSINHILENNPDVNFLFHGLEEVSSEIGKGMESHPNFYYSVDAPATVLFGWEVKHAIKGPTKEEYLDYIRDNFDILLNKAIREWKPLIEAHPDQFMWGTDRWYGWSFDYEVGGLLEEFGRSFIGQLDPSVQEKFAYKNAERMLEER